MVTNDTSWYYVSELSEKLKVYSNCITHQIRSLNSHEVDVKNVLGAKQQLCTYTELSQVNFI